MYVVELFTHHTGDFAVAGFVVFFIRKIELREITDAVAYFEIIIIIYIAPPVMVSFNAALLFSAVSTEYYLVFVVMLDISVLIASGSFSVTLINDNAVPDSPYPKKYMSIALELVK